MTATDLAFNPLAPGFAEDPYPQYAEMRRHAPVQYSPLGAWMLFCRDDANHVLRSPAMSADPRNAVDTVRAQIFEEFGGERLRPTTTAMGNLDGEDHRRIRGLVSRVFTPRAVAALAPMIERLVANALAPHAGGAPFDLVAALARPVPVAVITAMLGLPATDNREVASWAGAILKTLDPIPSPDDLRAAAEATEQLADWTNQAIAWKRAHPGDDLLTGLIEVRDGSDRLSEPELREQTATLYIAGFETTVALIGTGTLALIQHPDQAALVRADPALVPNAVEELLRYEPPSQFARRIAVEPVEVRGETIEPGATVVACIGSANRDETHFGPTANVLDVTRPNAREHLSFSAGPHHCLGAALARLEAQVAFAHLLAPGTALDLAGDEAVRWNGRFTLRGLSQLRVSLAPSALCVRSTPWG